MNDIKNFMKGKEREKEEKVSFARQRHMMCITALIPGPGQCVDSNSISKPSAMIAIVI